MGRRIISSALLCALLLGMAGECAASVLCLERMPAGSTHCAMMTGHGACCRERAQAAAASRSVACDARRDSCPIKALVVNPASRTLQSVVEKGAAPDAEFVLLASCPPAAFALPAQPSPCGAADPPDITLLQHNFRI